MEIGSATFQVNVWLALDVPSLTVTARTYCPIHDAPAAMVPVMSPVVGLIDRPGGSPTAEYDNVPPPLAAIGSTTVSPSKLLWFAVAAMVMGPLTPQVNVRLAL